MKKIRSKRYRTYVLRCWRESPPAGPPEVEGPDGVWRFALVEVLAEQPQRGFASFAELVRFLRTDLRRPLELEHDQLRPHCPPL